MTQPALFDTLPDWLPREQWKEFLAMRKSIKCKLTEYGEKLALKELSHLRDAGHDPAAVLEQSILNNWRGLFPLKDQPHNGNGTPGKQYTCSNCHQFEGTWAQITEHQKTCKRNGTQG